MRVDDADAYMCSCVITCHWVSVSLYEDVLPVDPYVVPGHASTHGLVRQLRCLETMRLIHDRFVSSRHRFQADHLQGPIASHWCVREKNAGFCRDTFE